MFTQPVIKRIIRDALGFMSATRGLDLKKDRKNRVYRDNDLHISIAMDSLIHLFISMRGNNQSDLA